MSYAIELSSTVQLDAPYASKLAYSHNCQGVAFVMQSDNSPHIVSIAINDTTIEIQIDLDEIAEIQWSPNDDLIIIFDGNYYTYIHDVKTGQRIGNPLEDVAYPHHISWNVQGDAICYAGLLPGIGRKLIIRKVLTGEDIILDCGESNDHIRATWRPDGKQIITVHSFFGKKDAVTKFWTVVSS